MKFKIKFRGKVYNDEIGERNSNFKCEMCNKEIYGKKGKWEKDGGVEFRCLKCLIGKYGRMCNNERTRKKEEKESMEKAIKEIKEKYEIDLIALEL